MSNLPDLQAVHLHCQGVEALHKLQKPIISEILNRLITINIINKYSAKLRL